MFVFSCGVYRLMNRLKISLRIRQDSPKLHQNSFRIPNVESLNAIMQTGKNSFPLSAEILRSGSRCFWRRQLHRNGMVEIGMYISDGTEIIS